MKKKRINEGLVDKLITKFFDSLVTGQTKAYKEKLKNANLDPEILKNMERMEQSLQKIKDLLK